ncbi:MULTISPECIES: response regulator [Oceanospirillaceae]|uniref:Response regulator n=1 Tax=Oceanobacter antarcticus TaxID=3133425 RepID=A0ABW8NIL4_9GAMM|tara:strand:+ start:2534 stop:3286 length:753 start_codon:yes stop_codon:yes gene_type:complete
MTLSSNITPNSTHGHPSIPATPARVVVVDDHPLFRRGVVQLLNDSEHFSVAADLEHGGDLLATLEQHQPHLVLLDLNMPEISGLDLLRQIRQQELDIKVVVITASEHDSDLFEALSSGANGYLMKDTAPDDMLAQLDGVLSGEVALNNHSVTLLAQAFRQPGLSDHSASHPLAESEPSLPGGIDLTARERQTLTLIAQGLNNKLIARELGISDGTVKVYVKSLLRKLNLHSRLELAAWVHQHPDAVSLSL